MLPTFYIPHGGGPCFFMNPSLGPPGTWDKMADHLRGIAQSLDDTPKAILVISSHWEETRPTVTSGVSPSLIYDYYGFPQHTYRLKYPASGSPALARRVKELLSASGIDAGDNEQRGFDHGVFIPFLLIYPDAEIPIVELSLSSDLSAKAHLEIGAALRPLRDEGILIVGSGMSYHNFTNAFQHDAALSIAASAFDIWLVETLSTSDAEARATALIHWEEAPAARICHPREEHLIPLMVAAGAAGNDPGLQNYSDQIVGKAISGFRFG